MSRTVISLTSALAVLVAVVAGGAGVAAAQSRGEWRGAWEATPGERPALNDQFFRVEYSTGTHGPEQSEISGYVYNDYGLPAINVEIEIAELDASGQTVGTETRPVFGLVPAKGRAYFDVRVPTGASYRVKVQEFDFVEDGSSGHS